MLRTDRESWQATFLSSLVLAASGCGGAVADEGESAATGEDPFDVPRDRETGRAGAAPVANTLPTVPISLHESLRCEGGIPNAPGGGLMQCENGIVHRPVEPRGELSDEDTCASDDDCHPGTLCIASVRPLDPVPSCSTVGPGYRVQYLGFFACQQETDECAAVEQCGTGQADSSCALVQGTRTCLSNVPCGPAPVSTPEGTQMPGRPFLVDGEARVAPICHSEEWCGPDRWRGLARAAVRDLDERARAVAARHWQAAASMEHASIAAFARFTLQLLQLGAPPELCLASQEAMRDETEHAQLCFALAARYAGAPLGPGALRMAGALEEVSLAAVAHVTFLEGCVGETHAALEAAEALALATDGEVQRALARIARDERRHAELAWRFVAWALDRDSSGVVREMLQGELARLLAEQAPPSPLSLGSELEASDGVSGHGVMSAEGLREVRQATLRDIIVPCTKSLLARRGAGSEDSTFEQVRARA